MIPQQKNNTTNSFYNERGTGMAKPISTTKPAPNNYINKPLAQSRQSTTRLEARRGTGLSSMSKKSIGAAIASQLGKTAINYANREGKRVLSKGLAFGKRKTMQFAAKKLKDVENAAETLTQRTVRKLADKLPAIGKDFGMIEGFDLSKNPIMPCSVINNQRSVKMANLMERRVIHKTNYVTGFKPTKGVRMAAKVNGTGYSVLADSKIVGQNADQRDALTIASGFNSKHLHVPTFRAQMTNQDLFELMEKGYTSLSDVATPTERSNISVAIMNLKRQFLIHNQSANFSCIFKINIAKLDEKNDTLLSPFANAFMSSAEFDTTTLNIDANVTASDTVIVSNPLSAKVPWFYHHSGYIINAPGDGSQWFDVNLSLKSRGLMDAPYAKTRFSMVETFEKKLAPGDYWNFSHTHHCGPGIDLGEFLNKRNSIDEGSTQHPYTFLIWFEQKGTMCEGIYGELDSIYSQYSGLSPTYCSYEYKTSAYYVKDREERNTDGTQPTTRKVYRREYYSDPQFLSNALLVQDNKKERFVLPENIVNTTPGAGEMRIPVQTMAYTYNTGSVPGDIG